MVIQQNPSGDTHQVCHGCHSLVRVVRTQPAHLRLNWLLFRALFSPSYSFLDKALKSTTYDELSYNIDAACIKRDIAIGWLALV